MADKSRLTGREYKSDTGSIALFAIEFIAMCGLLTAMFCLYVAISAWEGIKCLRNMRKNS